jgi:hypothetical protein
MAQTNRLAIRAVLMLVGASGCLTREESVVVRVHAPGLVDVSGAVEPMTHAADGGLSYDGVSTPIVSPDGKLHPFYPYEVDDTWRESDSFLGRVCVEKDGIGRARHCVRHLTVTTPSENVAEVTLVRTPPRALAAFFIPFGLAVTALGTWSLVTALTRESVTSSDRTVWAAFSSATLAAGLTVDVMAAWALVAPPEHQSLYARP